MAGKRSRVDLHDHCRKLPDAVLGRRILAYLTGTELLLTVELVCTRFRTLSLTGGPWHDDNVAADALPALQSRETTQAIAPGAFLASGRLRFVTELALVLSSSDLHWLQQAKQPRLRSLRLTTQCGLTLRPAAFRPLERMASLTVRCGVAVASACLPPCLIGVALQAVDLRDCHGIRFGDQGIVTQELIDSVSRMPNVESVTLFSNMVRRGDDADDGHRPRRDSDPDYYQFTINVFEALARMPALRSLTVPSTWSLHWVHLVSQLRALSLEYNSSSDPMDALRIDRLSNLTALSDIDCLDLRGWTAVAACSLLTSLRILLRFNHLARLCELPSWSTLVRLDLYLVEPPSDLSRVEAWATSVADRGDLQLCLRVASPHLLKPLFALGKKHRLVREVHLTAHFKDEMGDALFEAHEALQFERLHVPSGSAIALVGAGQILLWRPFAALRFCRVALPADAKRATTKLEHAVVSYEAPRLQPPDEQPPEPGWAALPARTIEFVIQRPKGRFDQVSERALCVQPARCLASPHERVCSFLLCPGQGCV